MTGTAMKNSGWSQRRQTSPVPSSSERDPGVLGNILVCYNIENNIQTRDPCMKGNLPQ